MTKRMLIDASHAEETRVVVLDGNRLEDFDVETSTKRQLKGNIYLAKVVRVEPSLQAAFVEYGGNRHGFLAFSEIHPDYYQIPVADRQRLIEMEAEEARREEEEADLELALGHAIATPDAPFDDAPPQDELPAQPLVIEPETLSGPLEEIPDEQAPVEAGSVEQTLHEPPANTETDAAAPPADEPDQPVYADQSADQADTYDEDEDRSDLIPQTPPPETIGGDSDSGDERGERRMPSRFLRNYKIQEVIRRRQILLVQVVKEERGTKGAALTTYLSLAGRFSVLMPNSPRGGGISRKITSATDRRRLKEVMVELDIPRGMGLIVRTAGANRPKPEIKRDCEYLLRLWDDIREHTMKSVAPALIYEEASLIKRAIRDVYSRDVDDIQVDGEEGWRAAHDFMRMLMPSHAKKVQLWRDPVPLFARHQVEAQLDGMLLPTVQLRSGGYLVINQAEALVAIDVNSGRSTRERGIEETALRTNLEAADEVARQLRLRDLAGLIVIDFIDMEAKKHNAMVERRMKEALKNDRARIQVGHISHFGLLEMSRQRLRPSLAETSFIACPHCAGTGHVRSTESAAIHVLRGVEDEGGKRRAAEIVVHVATPIALYLLNHKRERMREIEARYAMRVIIAADDSQVASQYRIERVRPQIVGEALSVVTPDAPQLPLPAAAIAEAEADEEEAPDEEEDETEDSRSDGEQMKADGTRETPEEADRRRKRRRRRRRGRRDDLPAPVSGETEVAPPPPPMAADGADADAAPDDAEPTHIEGVPEHADPLTAAEEEARNRRRGRRGGRRRRREPSDGVLAPVAELGAEQPDLIPIYAGPTPANPFGGQAFDIFDVLDQAEQALAAPRPPAEPEPPLVTATAPAALADPEPAPIMNTVAPEPAPEAVDPGSDAPLIVDVPPPQDVPGSAAPRMEAIAETTTEAITETTTEPAPETALEPVPDTAPEPAAEIVNTTAPEPASIEPVADPVPAPAEPDITVEPVPVMAEAPPVAANDAAPEPLVKPIMIGSADAPPVEKKRGWWRR
jgi:ribonuclease E